MWKTRSTREVDSIPLMDLELHMGEQCFQLYVERFPERLPERSSPAAPSTWGSRYWPSATGISRECHGSRVSTDSEARQQRHGPAPEPWCRGRPASLLRLRQLGGTGSGPGSGDETWSLTTHNTNPKIGDILRSPSRKEAREQNSKGSDSTGGTGDGEQCSAQRSARRKTLSTNQKAEGGLLHKPLSGSQG
ncbi:hypothetical protein NDU88_002593 [Pleurodeles waltl]|uniref:Uncharacterized protein n=1 Tax=Pleurodeles waltl TaxID=8319 RepID=A0AAV7T2U3_PLEWA|nr:hypothetical protein NDU88_002593 [Pleurodeles waltl]